MDQSGAPVPNVRVGVYPPFDLGSLPKTSAGNSTLGVTATSTVNFGVAAPARVNLVLNDLDGTTIQNLMENRLLNPGTYAVTLSLQRRDGARVMMCRIVAVDTASGNTLFRDSNYVTLWQSDYQIAFLGYTSASGIFESRDTLSFPYVLSLPPIVVTRYDPTPLGAFLFPDSCTIALTDTSRGTWMTLGRRLVRGVNEFVITWNPAGTPEPPKAAPSDLSPAVPSLPRAGAVDWRLYQNYPNPFN